MADVQEAFLRDQLLDRRQRLETALVSSRGSESLLQLLDEVDSALERMKAGTYGICETCHDTIEEDRLITDPLIRYCLDHLTPSQRRALEQDLELASQLQRGLLPIRPLLAGRSVLTINPFAALNQEAGYSGLSSAALDRAFSLLRPFRSHPCVLSFWEDLKGLAGR